MLRPLFVAALVGLVAGDLCRPGSPPANDFACIECDTAGTQCTECNYGSYLHENGTCIACEKVLPHCLECSDADTCTLCAYWYGPTLDGERLTCARCADKRCVDCRDDWQECVQCDLSPSGQPTSLINGTCVVAAQACGEGCTSCTAGGTCSACGTGLGLEGGRCLPCAAGDGCERCDGDVKRCTQCEYGKALSDGRCVGCSQPNCMSCPKSPDACELCNADYFESSNGTCLPLPEGCVSVEPNGTCSDCIIGYSLSGGTCKRCTAANCQQCEVGKLDQCVSCGPPDDNGSFALVNGTCVKCAAAHCEICQEDNPQVCQFCLNGYYKTETGACLEASIEGCEVPAEDGKTCKACTWMMGLVDGKCVKCQEELQCTRCDGSPTKCSECDASSVLEGGACKYRESSMTDCTRDSDGKCIGCMCSSMPDGSPCFTLVDGVCRPCADPNCASCSTTHNCTDCRRYTSFDEASGRCRLSSSLGRPDDVPSR